MYLHGLEILSWFCGSHNPQWINGTRESWLVLSPPTPNTNYYLFGSGIRTELRGFCRAYICKRAQAFLRRWKKTHCMSRVKCNAPKPEFSKERHQDNSICSPKSHLAILTQAQTKYCSSTRLPFFFFLKKKSRHFWLCFVSFVHRGQTWDKCKLKIHRWTNELNLL